MAISLRITFDAMRSKRLFWGGGAAKCRWGEDT